MVAVNVLVAVGEAETVSVVVVVAEAVEVEVGVLVVGAGVVLMVDLMVVLSEIKYVLVAVAVAEAEAVINPSKINSGGSRYETEKEGRVCLISDLHIFVFLISQVFEAFFENSNLFLIILNILVEFLSLSLLTRFNII